MQKTSIREAIDTDLISIVEMLSNDPLAKKRESFSIPLSQSYLNAFEEISRDPNTHLFVVEYENEIIGVLQINFLTYLTYQGGTRAQIEGVRVRSNYRSKGIGKLLIAHAIETAKKRNCHVLQLTTDKKRRRAIKFYEEFGFKPSHEGMKLFI